MTYYAHSENQAGIKEPVAAHLKATAALACQFASVWGRGEEGKAAGLLHDLGKYTELFQGVLTKKAINIDHATPGAKALLLKYRNEGMAAALAVQGHHEGLQSGHPRELSTSVSMKNPVSLHGKTYSSRDVECLLNYFQQDGLKCPNVINSDYHLEYINKYPVAAMLYARMLFSALVDADFLATEAHFAGDHKGYIFRAPGSMLNPHKLLFILLQYMEQLRQSSTSHSELLSLRNDLFQACLVSGEQPRGVYTLTAPTGSGKTLSMLAFALKHAAKHNLQRIIFVLPYLNIIEQNARVYYNVFKSLNDKSLILEDHSLAELPEEQRLLAENWDAPIIVTTTIRFFEGLFANQSSACRRLHNIANAVILFDEAQSMPPGLTIYTLATLSYLVKRFGCSVVFSTATQPAFTTFDEKVKYFVASGWQPKELIPEELKLFQRTRKIKVQWREHLSWEQVAEEVISSSQVLVIVNTRKQAKALYQIIKSQTSHEGIYHLSTDMCSAHRLAIINAVEERLKQNSALQRESCHLISTQCVEAGVDLDFPVVWRALGPLEAISQAAGRCNREGKLPFGEVTVFRPPLEDEKYPNKAYEKAALEVLALLKSKGYLDIGDPEVIQEYYQRYFFDNLHHFEKQELAEAIHAYNFKNTDRHYRWISDFTVNILVPYEPELEVYGELCDLARQGKFNRKWLKRARFLGVGQRLSNKDEIWDYLEPVRDRHGEATGWYILLNHDAYSQEIGLNISFTAGAYFA